MINTLHYGDNLDILSDPEKIPPASVDLIYLDPPFNSNANYNILFKSPTGIAFTVEGAPKDLPGAEDLARRDKYQFQWWAVSMVDAMPFGGRKKGADGGIDGIIYFKPDGKRTEKALVSVKGGDTVGVQMIRDLHSAMEREKAPIGVFICKVNPTTVMEKEAAAVGRFHAEATGKSYPRLQIVTLAELFQGKRPDIPYVDPTAAFKRAGREDMGRQEKLL